MIWLISSTVSLNSVIVREPARFSCKIKHHTIRINVLLINKSNPCNLSLPPVVLHASTQLTSLRMTYHVIGFNRICCSRTCCPILIAHQFPAFSKNFEMSWSRPSFGPFHCHSPSSLFHQHLIVRKLHEIPTICYRQHTGQNVKCHNDIFFLKVWPILQNNFLALSSTQTFCIVFSAFL